ncbi:hypothetical protein YH65_10210 [Sulfurovum lithotrophicum]|uniref:Sulfotransferase domain-containing protein n=1 Tax=Sulfurovum lithotrophicum TaxID=206403 RepID=A0A7U4RRF4_9BACT|nr:hypothetical protein [Sulfurovum lithotrophicum]AKF25716.1 hypothetical protein YH65_10210 [Sulfurovum lithotrophicum]
MSKKHLFLHIGTEKTGTTSIQSTLRHNEIILKAHSILFPSSPLLGGNYSGFVYSFLEPEEMITVLKQAGAGEYEGVFRDNPHFILDTLSKQIRSSECQTVIISSELLHSRITTDEEIKKIKAWAEKEFDEITVVCYLRRQVDMMISAFSTRLKEGGDVNAMIPELFENFIDHLTKEEELPHYIDYRKMLDQWSRYFPDMVCREFSRDTMLDGDVVKDFLSLVAPQLQMEQIEIPQEKNQTLDGKVLELLAKTNQYIPKFINNTVNAKQSLLVDFFEQIPAETKMLPSLEMATSFQNFFKEDNQYLSEKYFNNQAIFKGPMKFGEGYKSGLTPEEIADIFVALWQKVKIHLNRLNAENKFLKAEIAFSQQDYKKALTLLNQSMANGIRLPEAIAKRKEIFAINKQKQAHMNKKPVAN